MTGHRSVEELAVELLGKPADRLTTSERRVLTRISRRELLEDPLATMDSERQGVGDRLADRVAAVGGSWGFIAAFGLVLLGWMLINSGLPARFGLRFDPYPYIFLNLMLSMLAALQAPVIMMSQNRQSARDRKAAEYDYVVNLRAELEILRLHDKLDALRGAELMSELAAQGERIEQLTSEIEALRRSR